MQFSRRCELRLVELLARHGWYARAQPSSGRHKDPLLKGDVLAWDPLARWPILMLDHQSTQQLALLLNRQKLQRVQDQARQFQARTKLPCLPLLTYSLYRQQTIWVLTDRAPHPLWPVQLMDYPLNLTTTVSGRLLDQLRAKVKRTGADQWVGEPPALVRLPCLPGLRLVPGRRLDPSSPVLYLLPFQPLLAAPAYWLEPVSIDPHSRDRSLAGSGLTMGPPHTEDSGSGP